MSIRIKLMIIYMIIFIVSIFLIAGAGMTYIAKTATKIASTINEDESVDQIFLSIIDLLAEFKQAELYDQEKTMTEAFMQDINNRVQEFSGFLITEIDGDINSLDNDTFSEQFYEKLLKVSPEAMGHSNDPSQHFIEEANHTYFVYRYEFEKTDVSINYYIVIDITKMQNKSGESKHAFMVLLISLILIIVLPLTYVITKDIIRPLKKLEKGALHIKDGNLNFKLETKTKNEIGRVILAFEKMRSELKKSIDHQLQIEANRKELISNISHDLKTPITSIKGYVEGIRDGVASSPEKLAKYLDVIYHKSEDMDRLIDDLFLFSKLDLHRVPFDIESVLLKPFYESCMDELHLEYDKQGIVTTSNYSLPEDCTVMMDAQKIKRVILNIVNNAVKFMDKSEKNLAISFTQDQGFLSVSITDNGTGIEASEIDKVFERFYKSDPSRNSNAGGSGLGLAIAKQIIEQHQGKLQARSEKGKWTTMTFTLPIK